LALHHFTSVTTEVPPLAQDQVLIRVIFAQVAPAARAVMTTTTPFAPTNPGDGILTAVVGEVLDGPPDGPAPGTIVTCYAGWEQYSMVPVSQVRPVQTEGPLVQHLGLLGQSGLAAYFGMVGIGRPQAGETVVVSAAAGGWAISLASWRGSPEPASSASPARMRRTGCYKTILVYPEL
jgi:NADPH-dependent curcumin reductase CurA